MPEHRFPLEAFEHYMLADCRTHIRMGDCYRFSFAGTFERQRFQLALENAVKKHPLLRSRVEGTAAGATRELRWAPAGERPYLSWASAEVPPEVPPGRGRMIDLSREPGLRVFLRERRAEPAKTMMLLQVHHAASDAAGVFRFVEDLLAAYAQGVREPAGEDNHDLSVQLKTRGQYVSSREGRIQRGLRTLWHLCKFFAFRPRPLELPPKRSGARAADEQFWPPAVSEEFSAGELKGLLKSAKAAGVSFNDLMLHELFLTIGEWNQARSPRQKPRVRIAMPVNMREDIHANLPAANVLSLCYLDRSFDSLRQPQKLLAGIHEETRKIKRYRLERGMLWVLRAVGAFKRGITTLVRPNLVYPCYSTTVLSNLGIPFQGTHLPQNEGLVEAAGVTLESVEAMPAGRPYMPVGFTVNTYGGKLTVTISYDPDKLDADVATALLREYTTRLRRYGAGSDKKRVEQKSPTVPKDLEGQLTKG